MKRFSVKKKKIIVHITHYILHIYKLSLKLEIFGSDKFNVIFLFGKNLSFLLLIFFESRMICSSFIVLALNNESKFTALNTING